MVSYKFKSKTHFDELNIDVKTKYVVISSVIDNAGNQWTFTRQELIDLIKNKPKK